MTLASVVLRYYSGTPPKGHVRGTPSSILRTPWGPGKERGVLILGVDVY